VRHAVLEVLAEIGIVPVIRADDERTAFGAAEALLKGGIPVCEITMTVPGAIEVIASLSKEFTEALTIGAGTVNNVKVGRRALEAGCQFVVTPTVKLDVISLCKGEGTCVIGGALSPTEILSVWDAGASAVKVFPVKAVGGAQYIRMIHDPFPEIDLVPTGGVDLNTLPEYLKAGAVFVGAGGDLVNKETLKEGRFREISERARQYMAVIQTVRTESAKRP
jgi:2-dehydro-3-deoxyphosphogluconate aldolase/(4S)-4-hydroxy-2-oxoglutarate aldolase